MPRANLLRPSTHAGELSPHTAARVDLQQYPFAAETLENIVLLPEGGWMRRPGFRFVKEVKDSNAETHLLRFRFNVEQAYPLEFGNNYIRFYRNQGRIEVADTDAAITNGDFPSGITDWDDRSTGSGAISHDAVNDRLSLVGAAASVAWAEQDVTTTNTGTEHVLAFEILGAPGDTVEVRIGTTTTGSELVADAVRGVGRHVLAFTPSASPFYVQFRNSAAKTVQIDNVSLLDNAPLELVSPWATAEVPNLRYAQAADAMYIAHGDHRTRKLLRYGHSSWSLEEVGFLDGPYLDQNTTATTLQPSVATGLGITITASATTGINDGQGFLSTDIGRLVRIQHGTTWGNAVITGITSTLIATADVKTDFGAATAQAAWMLGAWSETTGFPRAVVFHDGRLLLGRTTEQPQTLGLSQSQDFENMQPDSTAGAVEDDDAILRTLASNSVDTVLWMRSGPFLVVGTASAQWIIRATEQDETLTPTNFNAKPRTTRKCADIEAVQVDEATVFVQAGKRRVADFGYDATIKGWRTVDLTRLAEHVTGTGVEQLEEARERFGLVLARRTDGQVGALSYSPAESRAGWSRWILGGSFSTGDAVVESMTVIPGNSATGSEDRDEIWIVVKRTVNGATKRYIEFMEKHYEDGDDQEDAFYVDSGLTYDGAATDTITGLDHLEGETVSLLTDGAKHPSRTVSAGQITLDASYSVVQAGLSYTSTYKSLKAEGGAAIGPALAQTKRIGPVGLVLDNTLGLEIGPDAASLYEIPFREVGDAMDAAVPLFTGEKTVEDFPGDWETDPRIVIQSDSPLPMTVLAIVPRVDTNDNV